MNRYFMYLVLVATSAVTISWGGWWTYFTLAMDFLLIPLFDEILNMTIKGDDKPTPAHESVLWSYALCHMALILWGAYLVTQTPMSLFEQVGIALSVGSVTGGLGITHAHELVHRSNRTHKLLGEALLTTVTYPHFAVEHVFGHHVNVATPEDPATARRGESIYAFLVRTVTMGYIDAWHIEAQRLGRKNKPWYSLENRMIWYHITTALWYMIMSMAFGPDAIWFLLVASGMAILQLETVNYVEHYGLMRKQIAPGKYEPMTEDHAWDCDHWLSNSLLINLQLHSDHHMHSTRTFPRLRTMAGSRKLPASYPTMILLALVPPLWKSIMDPKLVRS